MSGLSIPFYTLVGPTAVGKTRIAHKWAVKHGCPVISADSMLVYRGMDIGTAKPSMDERAEVTYLGLDLTDPSESFSTGSYVCAVEEQCRALPHGTLPIVAGGTGLYVRALMQGLDDVAPADNALRAESDAILTTNGITGLQQWAESRYPGLLERLDDPMNARRIVRAMEWSAAGTLPDSWKHKARPVMLGLNMDRTILKERIALRVHQMYAEGLLEEARKLRAQMTLSSTALQAIGYAEAFAVLDGQCNEAEAIEKTIIRTRRLAKRQFTWFRHQAAMQWIDIHPDMNDDDIVAIVERCAQVPNSQ